MNGSLISQRGRVLYVSLLSNLTIGVRVREGTIRVSRALR